MELKDKLKKARLNRGLTQMQLSNLVGAAQATINKLELGQIKNPSFELAIKIANVLEVDIFETFATESLMNELSKPNNSEIEKLKVLVFHALEMYESTEAFFAGGIFNPEDPEDEKKFDEYRVNLRKFKNGMYKNLVLVGFCTQEEITEYKNSINPNKK
jgi:DNA-binding XRE family transcriptional regulator